MAEQLDARGKARAQFQTVNELESRTVQSDSHEADIKTILSRHGVTGVVEHLNRAELVYGDVTGVTDYAQAMRNVREAEAAFRKLPSKVREVFGHDAARWLDAANDGLDEEQRAKLVKLGFLEETGEGLKEVTDAGDLKPVATGDVKPAEEVVAE